MIIYLTNWHIEEIRPNCVTSHPFTRYWPREFIEVKNENELRDAVNAYADKVKSTGKPAQILFGKASHSGPAFRGFKVLKDSRAFRVFVNCESATKSAAA